MSGNADDFSDEQEFISTLEESMSNSSPSTVAPTPVEVFSSDEEMEENEGSSSNRLHMARSLCLQLKNLVDVELSGKFHVVICMKI